MDRQNEKVGQNMTYAQALGDVRRITLEVLSGQDASVYLFGSWARTESTPASDIDLAIEPHVPLPPGMLARLRDKLDESHVPYRVEVVDLSGADPAFRRRVLKEGVLWNG